MKNKILLFSSLILLIPVLTGFVFSDLEDIEENLSQMIRGIGENVTSFFGKNALTEDGDLQGERTFGEDEYEGTYHAEYQNFTGTENLFGGASLEEKTNDTLHLSVEATVQDGAVTLFWHTEDDTQELEFDEAGSATVPLTGSWEYLSIEGNDFSGDVVIEAD